VTVPPPVSRTDQVTALSELPVTVAVNCADCLTCSAAFGGAMPMVITGGGCSEGFPPTAEGPQAHDSSAAKSAPDRKPIHAPRSGKMCTA
jgi:hypothetical protein